MSLVFPKENRLKKNTDFRKVFRCRRVFRNRYLNLYIGPEGKEARLGIVVGKKIGKANIRNRIKRIIREIYRKDIKKIVSSNDIILIPNKPFDKIDYKEAKEQVLRLMQDAGLIKG